MPATDIFLALQLLGEFEWARVSPARGCPPERLICPPMITWRYREPSEEKAEVLANLVQSFSSSKKWEFSSLHRNWYLMPARLSEYVEEHGLLGTQEAVNRLMKEEPEFGRQANAELRRLAEFIQNRVVGRANPADGELD